MQRIRVPPEQAGQRVDRFLQARFHWRSRAWVQLLLREHSRDGLGKPLKPARLVRADEEICLYFQPRAAEPEPALDVPLPVLYEDETLYVIDKPAGLPVHARGKQRHRAIIHLLRKAHPELGLDLAHRLDRETSGVLVLTKNQVANGHIKEQLRRGTVRKQYLTIAHGLPLAEHFDVALPMRLSTRSAIRMKMETHSDGAHALTHFEVLERHASTPEQGARPSADGQPSGFSLLRARPRTGRQHQIRVHLDAAGHPVVGDKIYGLGEELFLRFDDHGWQDDMLQELLLPRHALHAAAIELCHPATGEPVVIESPLPPDLRALLSRLTHGEHACPPAGDAADPSS